MKKTIKKHPFFDEMPLLGLDSEAQTSQQIAIDQNQTLLTNREKADVCIAYLNKYLKEEAKVAHPFNIVYDVPLVGDPVLKIEFNCTKSEFNSLSREILIKGLNGLNKKNIKRVDDGDDIFRPYKCYFKCALVKVYAGLPQEFLFNKLQEIEPKPKPKSERICCVIS